jgi:hypothetical protein
MSCDDSLRHDQQLQIENCKLKISKLNKARLAEDAIFNLHFVICSFQCSEDQGLFALPRIGSPTSNL